MMALPQQVKNTKRAVVLKCERRLARHQPAGTIAPDTDEASQPNLKTRMRLGTRLGSRRETSPDSALRC
jgi:hypothetical protein